MAFELRWMRSIDRLAIICFDCFCFFFLSCVQYSRLTVQHGNEIPNKYLNQFNTNHYISCRRRQKKNKISVNLLVKRQSAIHDRHSHTVNVNDTDFCAHHKKSSKTDENWFNTIFHVIFFFLSFFVSAASLSIFIFSDRRRRRPNTIQLAATTTKNEPQERRKIVGWPVTINFLSHQFLAATAVFNLCKRARRHWFAADDME